MNDQICTLCLDAQSISCLSSLSSNIVFDDKIPTNMQSIIILELKQE